MSTYTKFTWETIDLPNVSGTTYFLVLDHQPSGDPSQDTDILYSGVISDGYGIKSLDSILSSKVKPASPVFTTGLYVDTYKLTFYIYYTKDDWDTYTYDEVNIIYDWTYLSGDKGRLSNPIYNLLDKRQYFMFTAKSPDGQATPAYAFAVDGEQVQSFTTSGDKVITYIQDLTDIQYTIAREPFRWSYDYMASANALYNNGHILSVNSSYRYLIAETCYRYCIYYINKAGGWDSLLFGGKAIQTDDYTRYKYKSHYQANSLQFGTKSYLNKINETWQLNTNIFSDDASEKMDNLVGSCMCYLHDLETNKITPVIITDSKLEWKNWKNQNRQFAKYTVEVASSQEKYRQ